ncbi:BLUF domain-containing protein [Lacinutrix cladophorae]
MKLRRLVYSSQATTPFSKRDLLNLLHDSRGYNTIDNISGVLMHSKGFFIQVIEGEPEIIDDLLFRIRKDSRHTKIKIIYDNLVNNRLFKNWAMGCADFDDPSLSMLPGITTEFSNPKVMEDLINKLPETANFLIENLTEEQIHG